MTEFENNTIEEENNNNAAENIEAVSEEQTENSSNSGKEKPRNPYAVYDYFVKTPSVFIAIISALITALSFLVNYVSYIIIIKQLNYWEVDKSVVSTNDRLSLYTFSIAIISLFIYIIASELVSTSFNNYVPFKTYVLSVKKRLKKDKETKKTHNKAIQILEKSYSTHNNSSKKEKEQKKELEKIKVEYNKINNELNNIQNELMHKKKSYKWRMRLQLFIAFFVLLFVDFFMLSILSTIDISDYWVSIVIMCLSQFFSVYFINWVVMNIRVHSNIKQYSKGSKSLDELEAEIKNIEYPSEKIKNHGIRSLFSNFSLLTILISVFIVFLTLIVVTSTLPNKNFLIKKMKYIEVDTIPYVAVYSDSEVMVFEEVEISNGVAKIHTSNQKIIPVKNGISYKIVEFEKVEKINIERINSNEDNITNNGESLE